MFGKNSILLYSKYSDNCQNLSKLMEEAPIDVPSFLNLSPLCIDNEKVRKRIQSCKDFKIKGVPCILLVLPSGEVEQYEGGSAFNLVADVIKNNAPQQPVPNGVLNGVGLQPVQQQTNIPEQRPLQAEPIQPLIASQITSIGDLQDEGMRQEGGDSQSVAQSVSQSLSGNRPDPSGVKSGKPDLMSMALAMQKSRESEDSTSKNDRNIHMNR